MVSPSKRRLVIYALVYLCSFGFSFLLSSRVSVSQNYIHVFADSIVRRFEDPYGNYTLPFSDIFDFIGLELNYSFPLDDIIDVFSGLWNYTLPLLADVVSEFPLISIVFPWNSSVDASGSNITYIFPFNDSIVRSGNNFTYIIPSDDDVSTGTNNNTYIFPLDDLIEYNVSPWIHYVELIPTPPIADLPIYVYANITDDGAVRRALLEFDNGTVFTNYTMVYDYESGLYRYRLDPQKNGTVIRLRVYAKDDIDLWSKTDIIEYTVVIDNVSPVVSIVFPENNTYFPTDVVTISWNASDNYGFRFFEVYLDGVLVANISGKARCARLSGIGEGNHTVLVRGLDMGLNMDEDIAYLIVDLTPPTVTSLSPGYFIIASEGIINITWTATDNYGVDHFEVMFGDSWETLKENFYVINVSQLDSGVYTLVLRVYDIVGHYTQEEIIICVDRSSPSVTILNPHYGEYINSSSVTLVWNMSDDTCIDYIDIYLDGLLVERIYNSASSYTLQGLSNGQHTVAVKVYDIVGNEALDQVLFYVDTIPPTVTITNPSDMEIINSDTVHVSWVATDNIGIHYYLVKIDNSSWIYVNDTGYTFTNLCSGPHTVVVMAIDRAGNTEIDYVTFEVRLEAATTSFDVFSAACLPFIIVTSRWRRNDE